MIDIDGFIKGLAEAHAQAPEEVGSAARVLNPLPGSTPEELQVALAPIFAGLEQAGRVELASKLVAEGLLSPSQAAASAGMQEDALAEPGPSSPGNERGAEEKAESAGVD